MTKLTNYSSILYRNRRRLSILNRKCRYYSNSSTELTSTEGLNNVELPKTYDIKNSELECLKKWRSLNKKISGAANERSVFRMLLPPPNVTGKLHLGHFLTLSVEDTIARWKSMSGVRVEWIPGFDHAGIATQSVVNRKIAAGGNADPSKDLRQTIEDFSSINAQSIRSQLEKSGAMIDWDKTYYTLDDNHSSVVKEAFVQLFESGLIRRSNGLVNWSCALQTSVADVEIDEMDFDKRFSISVPNYKESVEFGVLYYVQYSVLDSDKKLVVATSRPETMFGDVALAVNPGDARYAEFIGKQVINPLTGVNIPVIADKLVKQDFGSGVVKITPAHDKMDFMIGSANKLELKTIYTPDGMLNETGGKFQGEPRFVVRRKVIEFLRESGAILQESSYSGSIGLCSRSGDVIEPRIMPHWFLLTQFLSNKLIQAINDRSFLIVPENHCRSLLHKIRESQDWCLSRQIKWGHQIPAYYHVSHPGKWVAAWDLDSAVRKLEKILDTKVDKNDVIQDPDVLDTWFSSALIPLAVSGWPDSETYKEISLMETGHDILLFWVWRMTIMSLALVNRFPFRHVLLHGIVTDGYGRKMSKSKGNVIDPTHIIEGISYQNLLQDAKTALASGELEEKEYNLRRVTLEQNHSHGFAQCGNDALRLTLLSQDIFAEKITLDLNYLDSCRRFTNKLWQALRFLKLHSKNVENSEPAGISESELQDSNEYAVKWILSSLVEYNRTCESSLNQAKFHLYAEATRKFFYQDLCDVYIELIKGEMSSGTDVTKLAKIMQYVFEVGVKLAHPLVPFVTEEIWSHLVKNDGKMQSLLLEQEFPSSKDLDQFYDPELLDSMGKAMQFVREIRSVKQRSGWGTKEVPQIYLEGEKSVMDRVAGLSDCIEKLAKAKIEFRRYPAEQKGSYGSYLVDVQGNICRIHVPMMNQVAKASNHAKLEKLKLKLLKLQQQYENPSFQLHAPPATKEKLKKKVETLLLQIQCSANEDSKQNPNQP